MSKQLEQKIDRAYEAVKKDITKLAMEVSALNDKVDRLLAKLEAERE